MGIQFDRSASSVVVSCTACPWWRALALSDIEAYKSGERHEVQTHDVEPSRAADRRRLYEKRHASHS